MSHLKPGTRNPEPVFFAIIGAVTRGGAPARGAHIRIGCSGWQYRHWRGNFYPADLPPSRWLSHYATRFDTVEINNSFYRLPEAATFARWGELVPRRFVFAVKASRYLTHMKKLTAPEEPLDRMFERVLALDGRLGPVLYQLPPRWKVNVDRLASFLAALPQDVRQAVEFRDPSWYVPEVFDALERHHVALCVHDMNGSAPPRAIVGPFAYIRFHGPGPRYAGGYPAGVLRDWAGWIAAERGRLPVYVYFNNDVGGHAPRDAGTLREMLQ